MKSCFYFMVMLIPCLYSCDKSQPIALPADKQNLLGSWIAKQPANDNDRLSDNLMLVFRHKYVSYLRCINRVNGHSYYDIPNAKLTSISDIQFEIAADIYFTDWNKKFTISQLPYKNNGNWYMDINKITLRKLKPGEHSDHETWLCGKDESTESNSDVPF